MNEQIIMRGATDRTKNISLPDRNKKKYPTMHEVNDCFLYLEQYKVKREHNITLEH